MTAHSSRSTRRSQSIFLTKSGFRSRGRRHVVEATEHPNGSPRQGLIASIISAAADTDPTTIATLAVVGSTTTYALGWLVLLVIPMLAVVQAIASQIGMVTRRGLEDLVRERFGRATALALLLSVLAVDVMTFAADLEGGGAAMELLVPFDYRWWIAPLALWSVSILAWGDYRRVQGVLGYLPLVFIAYAVAAFMAKPDWRDVIQATLIPRIEWSRSYVGGAVALVGTTLTSYAYVWQEIEMKEDRPPLRQTGAVRAQAAIGAAAAGAIFWFIVVAIGATLGVHHHEVASAGDAASALAPIAGRGASIVFAVGLLASALLALPVLLATAAYLVTETFGWVGRLDESFFRAPRFYATMLVVTVVGCAIALSGIPPIRLLFASSIAGGLATPIGLVLLLLVANDRATMRKASVPRWLLVSGWATAAVVTIAAGCGMLVGWS